MVINWVAGKFRMHNSFLSQFLQEVIRISDMLERVVYKHIYRERNSKEDASAKDGATVPKGYWHISEFRADQGHESIQPFI